MPKRALITGIAVSVALIGVVFFVAKYSICWILPAGCTLYVEEGATDGNGTSERPFGTIQDALAAVRQRGLPVIRLRVSSGTYHADVQVDRPAWILGEPEDDTTRLYGSVRNPNGFPLTIQHCAILEPSDFAIWQVGGTLRLFDVMIKGTRRQGEHLLAGVGVVLLGARGFMEQVILDGNESGALWLEGAETKALLQTVRVVANKADPSVLGSEQEPELARLAAVTVTNGAVLLGEDLSFEGNEAIGLSIRESSQAHLRELTMLGTAELETAEGAGLAHNLAIQSGSVVELQDFRSGLARTGVFLEQAYLTAERGSVHDNSIGIVLLDLPPDYNAGVCIAPSVTFVNNTTRLSGVSPVPLPDGGGMEACPRVPWFE